MPLDVREASPIDVSMILNTTAFIVRFKRAARLHPADVPLVVSLTRSVLLANPLTSLRTMAGAASQRHEAGTKQREGPGFRDRLRRAQNSQTECRVEREPIAATEKVRGRR